MAHSYATTAQVTSRYASEFLKRITNFTVQDDETAIIESRIVQANEDASAAIDGYLQSRYPVPLSPAPDYLMADTVKVAVKLLVERKGFDPEGPDAAHVKAGDEVLKKYMSVAKGDISITLPGSGGETPGPTRVLSSSSAKMFTETKLDGY